MGQIVNSNEISTNDCVSKVLGKDYPGRVCWLGLGGLHSVAFWSTTRFSNVGTISQIMIQLKVPNWKRKLLV